MSRHYNKDRDPHAYKIGDKVLLKSEHVFPHGERNRPSKKLRAKFVGPFEILELIGPNAVKLALTGGLRNHPVFSVDSLKPYHSETRRRVAKSQGLEDGEIQWIPLEILKHKRVGSTDKWLVQWEGVDPAKSTEPEVTWEPLESFQNSHGTTQLLVEFEEDRTGLERTLETFNYIARHPGTRHLEEDGFEVYHTKRDETLRSVARECNVQLQSLIWQNEVNHPLLKSKKRLTLKFKASTQLRLPKTAQR